ncbi:MAG: hypothetical protein R3B09_08985 [Nannocystaceae bacterium]
MLLLAAPACHADEDDFAPDYIGERIEVDFEDPEFACPANLEALEEHVAALESYWSRPLSDRLRVSWTSGPAPSCERPGCYKDGLARGPYHYLPHELVHGYLRHAFPRSNLPSFLNEGLAVALSGADVDYQRTLTELLSRPEPLPGEDYFGAGHFARWLLEEYGSEAIARLLDQTEGDDLESAMRSILGESSAAISARYTSESPRYYPGWGVYSCASTGVSVGAPIGAFYKDELSCEHGQSLPFAGDTDTKLGLLWQATRFTVVDAGSYEIEASQPDSTALLFGLVRCLEAPGDPFSSPSGTPSWVRPSFRLRTPIPWELVAANGRSAVDLDAGTYVMWVARSVADWSEAVEEGILFVPRLAP